MGAMMPSGRGRGRGRRAGFSEINVTPFVDVMLVLLIIFMVTAPMLTAGVELDLPDTSAGALSRPGEPLQISVDKKGRVYIGETRIKLDELQPKLQAIVGEKKDTVIYISGDTGIDYGKVMEVMGEVSAAGFTKVALLTETKQRK